MDWKALLPHLAKIVEELGAPICRLSTRLLMQALSLRSASEERLAVDGKKLPDGTQKNHTRVTPRKKTHSLASNKQAETIARSARQKRHSSASKYRETISCQPAKRGTRSPSKQKETLTCQSEHESK